MFGRKFRPKTSCKVIKRVKLDWLGVKRIELMEENNSLYGQLQKLSGETSEETLEHVIQTLWKTRKTGLKTLEKSYIQSILNLPSPQQLDLVLACLRSLIRKSVHENFTCEDLLKLFPPNSCLTLQSTLVLLLQKYQNKWKEEASTDQIPWKRTSISYQGNVGIRPSFAPSAAEISSSIWPRQDEPIPHFNQSDVCGTTPVISEANIAREAPVSRQQVDDSADNLGILPRLKSMTWTMENRNSKPANRVAIISLKLQDYTKSPSGEREVKFQLTRDTLEAMLRSMSYISEQLTVTAGSSTEPLQKKQRP